MQITYQQPFVCEVTDERNGATVRTTSASRPGLPDDAFSPTQLVAAALGTCMLTTMAMVAERKFSLDLAGARVDVDLTYQQDKPHRIAGITLRFDLPVAVTEAQRDRLEYVANACPVHHAIHPDITMQCMFHWQAV